METPTPDPEAPTPAGKRLARRARAGLRSAFERMRRGWRRPTWKAAPYAAVSAFSVILLNNRTLFGRLLDRLDLLSFPGAACLLTILLTLAGLVGLVFLALGTPYVLKPLVVAGFLLSSVLSYFTDELGAVFDVGMIRNIVDALRERNAPEAAGLVSGALLVHVLLFGAAPSLLALVPRIEYGPFRRELRARAAYAAAGALLWVLVSVPNFRYLSYFKGENSLLRFYATPTCAINSLRKYAVLSWTGGKAPFVVLGADASRREAGRRRRVGILVVGETARADHFSLNGYARKTNPLLERRPLLNYTHARASGTSTAVSVPCMFSFLGKAAYSPERASAQSNVLDVIARAGVRVVWIENNSGHKGVCDRLGSIDARSAFGARAAPPGEGGCLDGALLELLDRPVDDAVGDVLLVLHTMGSHGPAYFRRYPPEFEVFAPCCKDAAPQQRPPAEVVNAYDNSIVYTDHVLDRLIAWLEARRDRDSAFLLYVSDHGESLGENGIYLHGLPDLIAPEAQTRIPLLAWLSPEFLDERGLDLEGLRKRCGAPCSHDNLPHTLLGLFEVETSLYRGDLDLLQDR